VKRAPVIARRELASYFYSPIAYVAMALFLVATGVAFWNDFVPGNVVGMRSIFEWMVWFLVFIVPVLCMGLMAQEWSSGTIESLMTAPVGEADVIVGKFLGSFGFLVILLLPTLLYVLVLRLYTRATSFDYGPIFSGYLGILLVGAMFVSIGLLCSSLTRSQIVAAVAAAAALGCITIIPAVLGEKAAISAFWRNFADQLVYKRYTDFSRGLIDTGHVVFFVALTSVFLFLSVKVLESRRWK
jgi:ABC-2 type transport system permease protein